MANSSLNIRNLGILAHIDAGKTTITEHMLYESGSIRTLGNVDKGTAHTDYMDVERKRGISVRAASTSFIWKGININIIDTPGHADFAAEVERSLIALDCAVLVVSAVEGIQAQTEILWKALRDAGMPVIIFINKIDRIGADCSRVLSNIKRDFSSFAIPLQNIWGEETAEPKVKDIWSGPIDDERLTQMAETIADLDEDIMNKYINGEKIEASLIKNKIMDYSRKGMVFPVLFGSAIKGIGIAELMDAIAEYLPGPSGSLEKPLSAMVFKVDSDENLGRIAHVRVYNGSIKSRDIVLNITRGIEEKVTQVRKINVSKYDESKEVSAGEIAGICGLYNAKIGDVLGSRDGIPKQYHLQSPYLKVQVYPDDESQYTELVEALSELTDEDPAIDMQWIKEKKEVHIKIMGAIQMEVLHSILKERFGIGVTFSKVSVIYKETPAKSGEGFEAYTMPKPCWAVLRFLIEPGERGSGVQFRSLVRTETILERYQKQVRKTLPKALEQGLYGWEVTDIKITLIDGEYHVMHTHAPDFAVATPMAIMNGLANTGTVLLEPVLKFHISAPEEAGGRILNDLSQMRGTFESPYIQKGMFDVEGIIPASTFMDYHIKLASMTAGRGTVFTTFEGYRECPLELGAVCPRRSVNPLDRAKYILYARNAFGAE